MTQTNTTAELCDVIEECYEFMLAYAAQGIVDDKESRNGQQLREMLSGTSDAVSKLAGAYAERFNGLSSEQGEAFKDFYEVLKKDAEKTNALIRLVLVQPRISSQLVDDLNASIHLRALLTDVFLLDEVLAIHN